MQRYFIKKENEKVIFEPTDINHIKRVMRYQNGDMIEIVYENEVSVCRIVDIDTLELEVVSVHTEDRLSNVSFTVAVSLVQEQKLDLILQKLTELGVDEIILVKTTRSIVKLTNEKIDKKINRWRMICKEASEQSKRTTIPKIEKIVSIKELIKEKKDINLICSLNETTRPLETYLHDDISSIMFVIGPEGGFSPEEEDYLMNQDFKATSLGKRVLRVETAAIYVASIINYIYKG